MTRELLRVAVKIKVVNGAAVAARAGTMQREHVVRKGVREEEKGLNEVGGNGWDSGDVRAWNGIHLLFAGPQ